MSFASLRRVLRSARKGLCSTCSKARYPQLEAAGAGHVGCLIYTFDSLGQLVKDEHDVTAMHVAARKNHISILIYIIENGLVDGVPRAKNGATPAHDAAGTGHIDCLRYILSHTKASASDVDSNNATPLHWAVQSGHLKIVQWLVVEAKAPIDCIAKNGVTPFHIAAARNYLEILRWLAGHAYHHHAKPRKLLNAKDKNGATPLYHAAHAGHIDVIQWLAQKGGGDPTIISTQGLAPLHAATVAGRLEAVQYLFQFGSATAPGGLRTTEGACALHFAAAEGHGEILQWLLQRPECTGNERDYYQSTPMHDAAENGRLPIVRLLCEHGADCTITDIEGNTPRDLADKNGQNKCAKYLTQFVKQKAPKGPGKKLVRNTEQSKRGLSRNKHTQAEMIDSYRNAPPHQLPVNVFEGDEEEDGDIGGHDDTWTTLRDLMGDEIQTLDTTLSPDTQKQLSAAEIKRRKLEEDMRKEAAERKKKREELLQQEEEIEKEIRAGLEAEEKRFTHNGKAEHRNNKMTPSSVAELRRLSLPANISEKALAASGIVEKRTQEFESRKGKKRFSLFRSRSKTAPTNSSKPLIHSQSWDSGLGVATSPYDRYMAEESVEYIADEVQLPEPPPLPSVEYLLGKRPVNLRKRASQTLKDEIMRKAASLGNEEADANSDDSDSHSSVGSVEHKHRRKKGGKRKKKKGREEDDNKRAHSKHLIPQSSPPRSRKAAIERYPTPIPSQGIRVSSTAKAAISQKLDFDSAFDELSNDLEALAGSPSSLSPMESPSPKSPISSVEASPIHKPAVTSGYLKPARQAPTPPTSAQAAQKAKRGAPKLQPHLQNKQSLKNVATNSKTQTSTTGSKPTRTAPISKIASGRNKSQKPSALSETETQHIISMAAKSPSDFMSVLTNAISSSPKQPRVMRQMGQTDTSSSPGSNSPTMDEIESQLNEMKSVLANASKDLSRRPPSPEFARQETGDLSGSDTESSEYTSSSESTTSESDTSSDDSSDEDGELKRPLTPRRPIMARNVGMAAGGLRGRGMRFNRYRMLSRYPKLLRKRPVQLDTIHEVPEEKIYSGKSLEEMADIFLALKLEKRYMRAWRKYMQIMKSAYRKAEKKAQRKRRDLMAKAFYAWIQVRNMAEVEKVDLDRSKIYYKRRLTKKVFGAWRSAVHGAMMPIARSASLQLISAEEKYLSWLNDHIVPVTGVEVNDINDSLADGIVIIKAIAHASKTNPPKYNHKPRVRLHRQDNWKTAHEYMKHLGINVKGIEPADLGNVLPAAIHNMFNSILKWNETKS